MLQGDKQIYNGSDHKTFGPAEPPYDISYDDEWKTYYGHCELAKDCIHRDIDICNYSEDMEDYCATRDHCPIGKW